MRVSLEWLRELVDVDVDVGRLTDALNMSGTKVERVHLPDESIEGVVAAEVVSIHGHPNADNLLLVDVRAGGAHRVVCGARNFEIGDKVPLATVGARIPAGRIEERRIRGETSRGMLCSGAELGVSRDHSGILVLPQDAEPGADVVSLLGLDDVVMELEITPNRPDCMGMIGVAREVAAVLGGELRLPPDTVETAADLAPDVSVDIFDPVGCPRYMASYVAGVTLASAPAWMARRLLAAGVRPISNVVDITNYVLMETGHPLHAFDAAQVAGHKIVVRRAYPDETLTTLDGVVRRLATEDLVIADPAGPLGIAGVMGGERSEVSDATRDVILEAAMFDHGSIAFTSRRYGLRTEASARFERGADPAMVPYASARAVRLMTELTAGRAAAAPVDAHPAPIEPATIRLRPARTDRLLGISVPAAEQADRLRSIGLGVSEQDGHLDVRVPTARRDLTREVDLVEEVARLVGLDRLRSTVPRGGSGGLERTQLAERALGRALVALGLWEAWTQSLFSERDLDLLGLAGDHPARSLVRLSNPMTEDESAMRTTLLPSLLRSVARNVSHGAPGVALFEIARVYAPSDEVLPHERLTLGIVFSGERAPKAWHAPARRWDFFSAKGVLGAALDALGISGARYGRASGMPFHPTRAAHVSVDGSSVGALGELHPDVCERFRVPHGAVAAELSLAHLFSALPERPRIQEVWRFPPVYMDLAFVLPADVEAGSVEEAVRAAGLPEVAAVRLFDVYEGEQVPAGRKSLAYALELRAPDRTLTDDEAVRVRDRVIAAISSRFGGELRS